MKTIQFIFDETKEHICFIILVHGSTIDSFIDEVFVFASVCLFEAYNQI